MCGTCATLRDYERAFQKGGHEGEDTCLPLASLRLTPVRDITSFAKLYRCPECGTFYLLKSYYEFLVSGSEEEQVLYRLKIESEADKYSDYWLR